MALGLPSDRGSYADESPGTHEFPDRSRPDLRRGSRGRWGDTPKQPTLLVTDAGREVKFIRVSGVASIAWRDSPKLLVLDLQG